MYRILTRSVAGMAALLSGLAIDHALSAEDDTHRPQAIVTEGVPQIPDQLWNRLRQYRNLRSAGFRGWAPDGNGILIQTRFGNTSQLHRVYEPGGRRKQVTFFDEPANGRFLPGADDGTLLLTMATGGNEKYQVLVTDPDDGTASLLTDGTSRNLLGPVRHDGLFALVSSNQRNGKDTDIYIADPHQPGDMTMILETDGEYWVPESWSRDGSKVLIRHYVSINECYAAVLEVASGEKTPIPSPNGGKTAFGDLRFSNDGNFAYVACDADSEFRQLARVDLSTMKFSWLSQQIPWDVESIVIAPPGGWLPTEQMVAFTVNEDGASGLYLMLGEEITRLKVPMGIISSLKFSPEGTQLGFTLSRPNAPADVYSLSLVEDNLTRWTFSETGGLDTMYRALS